MRSNKYYAVPEEGESLEHNVKGSQRKNHKYIARKLVNGKWRYTYKEDRQPGLPSQRNYKELYKKYQKDGEEAGDERLIRTQEEGRKAFQNLTYALGNKINAEKRKATGSSSLGNDRVLSDQTQNRLKAQSNAKKLATSGSLQKAKQEQAGYKKAASGLYETVNKKNIGAANKYSAKAKEASNKVASIGSSINAAKRKASGSSSLANQKQPTKKKKTSKVSKALKKGQSIINKLLGR